MKPMENGVTADHQAKRMLYVRTNLRLLRSCASRYVKLLMSSDGIESFQKATITLLTQISTLTQDLYGVENAETNSLISEFVAELQTNDLMLSKLLIDSYDEWLKKNNSTTVMIDCTFAAFRMSMQKSINTSKLLELVVEKYFKNASDTSVSWRNAVGKIGKLNCPFDIELLIKNNLLLCFHVCAVEKLETSINIIENSALFVKIIKCFEMFTEQEVVESKVVLCWGVAIYIGYRLMESTNSSNHLLMLARYFL